MAAIAFALQTNLLTSCETHRKATDTSVMEAVVNRVMYDNSMDALGIVRSSTSVKNVSAAAVVGRKIVVYDTSLAVRDSATGDWSAPILYTIEEDGRTESETSEQSATVEQDTLTSTHEVVCASDSTGHEMHESVTEKKNEPFGWRARLWVVVCLCLIIAIILLWKFARTLK